MLMLIAHIKGSGVCSVTSHIQTILEIITVSWPVVVHCIFGVLIYVSVCRQTDCSLLAEAVGGDDGPLSQLTAAVNE